MPDVNVTYIQETPIYAGPHPDHAEMVFNPRLGFTRDLAQADSDSGSYICNYERDGVEETQMVIITVHRKLFMNNSNFLIEIYIYLTFSTKRLINVFIQNYLQTFHVSVKVSLNHLLHYSPHFYLDLRFIHTLPLLN